MHHGNNFTEPEWVPHTLEFHLLAPVCLIVDHFLPYSQGLHAGAWSIVEMARMIRVRPVSRHANSHENTSIDGRKSFEGVWGFSARLLLLPSPFPSIVSGFGI